MIQSISKPERVYIGSAQDISKRWREHFRTLRLSKHHSYKLQMHYNKYGEEDLVFSILSECSVNNLITTEQIFLDLVNPYFNICKVAGSWLGQKHSDLSILKMSKAKIGKPSWSKDRKFSEEHKHNISLAKLGVPVSDMGRINIAEGHTDIPLSAVHKNNISLGLMGKSKSVQHKQHLSLANKVPILQYNKNMGFIRGWDSTKDATECLLICNGSISHCLTGKNETAGGYIWKYKLVEKVA